MSYIKTKSTCSPLGGGPDFSPLSKVTLTLMSFKRLKPGINVSTKNMIEKASGKPSL